MLRQPCGHCAKFLTAASRRSLGRVAVPVWLIILSDQRRIIGLVGPYPTNYLIRRRPTCLRPGSPGLSSSRLRQRTVCGISAPFGALFPTHRMVTHVFLSRLPLTTPKSGPFDLHVLCTPPALVLSQDQTLQQDRGACAPPDRPVGDHSALLLRRSRAPTCPEGSRSHRSRGSG